MRFRWKGSALAATAAAAMLGTTALGASLASAHRVRAAQTPQKGGTIVYALPTDTNIPWYFPYTNSSNATLYVGQLTGLLYQPLLYVNYKDQIDYSQSIAQKVTFNPQGTVFHVFMNPKWKWSDGTPITTADAQFGWNVLLATDASKTAPWPNRNNGNGNVPANVKSFQVNSKYEFTITLKQPANQEWFIYNGIGQIAILPAHAWNKYPTNIQQEIAYLGKNATNANFDNPVSGAFKLQSAVQNQAWTLVPNTNYSGQVPYVSRLILQYEASDTAEFAGLKTGQIQVGYLPAALFNARLELGDKMIDQPPFSYRFVWPNMTSGAENGVNKIFDNLYVREAMYMAINDNVIANLIFHGYASAEYGPIPAVPKTDFLSPSAMKAPYPYSPAKGKALLEQNGWQEVNGVMTKDGMSMNFTLAYPSGNQAVTETMEVLQQGWAQEGIKVTLVPQPFATLVGYLSQPSKWELVSGIGIIYGGGYPSGENLFYKNQNLDLNGWNNPTENALIQATESPAPNAQASLQRFYAYEDFTQKELPALWMPSPAGLGEVAPTVHGYTAYTANWVTGAFLPQYWWVSGANG